MIIEIVDTEENLITDFDLESNPFKVGEKLSISITNMDKSYYDVEDMDADFKITKIEHFFRKILGEKGMTPSELFSVQVYVEPLTE